MSLVLDILSVLINTISTWLLSNNLDFRTFFESDKREILVLVAAVSLICFCLSYIAKIYREDFPRLCGDWVYTAETEKSCSHGGVCTISKDGERMTIKGVREYEYDENNKKVRKVVPWGGEGIRSGRIFYYNYYHANGFTAGACFLTLGKDGRLTGELRLSSPLTGPSAAFSNPKQALHRYIVMEKVNSSGKMSKLQAKHGQYSK